MFYIYRREYCGGHLAEVEASSSRRFLVVANLIPAFKYLKVAQHLLINGEHLLSFGLEA